MDSIKSRLKRTDDYFFTLIVPEEVYNSKNVKYVTYLIEHIAMLEGLCIDARPYGRSKKVAGINGDYREFTVDFIVYSTSGFKGMNSKLDEVTSKATNELIKTYYMVQKNPSMFSGRTSKQKDKSYISSRRNKLDNEGP